jgi:arginine-tRNA-protein transferase
MNLLNDFPSSILQLYTTASYPCSYLPEKLARSQVATPDHLIDTSTYAKLVQIGFRRSGTFIYRPFCDHCSACVPVRVVVDDFSPNRTQRRTWKRHQDLVATQRKLYFHPDHYALYLKYQTGRHYGGEMNNDSCELYQNFILKSNVNSKIVEFHKNEQLCMISIIDELPDGISSVYTFFDPNIQGASLGTYSILWQIQQCSTLGLHYLYLGYWIKANKKMAYKANFQPLQSLIRRKWRRDLEANETD